MNKSSSFQYDDFGKGVDVFTRDTMIKESECTEGLNVWGIGKNSVSKRPGFVQIAEVDDVDKIDGIGTFYSATVRELLVMAGGKLYKVQSGIAERIGAQTWTAGARVDFCQAGGKLYISNGTETLREYNGTTTQDTSNGIVAKWVIFYKGSLWAAGNATYPTRLYRSGSDTSLGDFTYAPTANPLATSIFVGKDDGQDITGFFKHQDYLYVLKENSIWSATQGTDEFGIISQELVDPSRGSVSHRTIDAVDNDVFFFNEYGVYAFGYEPNITNQIRTNIVSLRVDQKVKSIQKTRLDEVAGLYFDNHYYLSYTSGGGSANDRILVYDRQRLGWWEWTVNANCLSEFKNSQGVSALYYGSSVDGKIFYLDETAKNDAGATITARWKTKAFNFGDYAQVKFLHHLVMYFGRMSSSITVNLYVDGTLIKSTPVNIGRTMSAGIGVGKIGVQKIGVDKSSGEVVDVGGGDFFKIPVNKMGRNMQIEIIDNQNLKGWELNSISGTLKPLNKLYFKQ